MNKKGFTLIEIIAVVFLLALLTLIVAPRVLEQQKKKEKEITDAEKKVLITDAENYARNHTEIYDLRAGNIIFISVSKLIEENAISLDADSFSNKCIRIAIDENDNFMSSLKEKCE